MSEGDSATPGWPDQRVTRARRSAPGAAPWERVVGAGSAQSAQPEAQSAPPEAQSTPPEAASGNHTHGVTVADLIARVTGSRPSDSPARHSAHPEPPAGSCDVTQPIAVVASYPDELPNLTTAMRVTPERVGTLTPAAPASPPRRKHKKSRRRPVILAGRSAAALFAVSALLLTGGAYQWQAAKNDLLRNVAALDPDSRDILDRNAQFGDENFLIVGVDTRSGVNSDMGAGTTDEAEGARSDTVMLVNIPANRKRVVAVSFPRDLAITPMKCQAWDAETGKYGPVYDKKTGEWSDDWRYTATKLNSAYAYGGPKCLVKVIQKMSGLSINRFMAVDFAGFAKMVDALGGVDVCSITPLEDYELGTVLASAGHQRLDGHSALNYVRARQITTESNGDYGRIKRQQLFLSSLLRSIISTDTLFSLSKLNSVVNTFIDDTYVDNVKTKDLMDLGQSLQGVAAGRITFVTVPTTGVTDADGNEEPRTDDIRTLFDAIIDDDPLPGENDTNTTTSPATEAKRTLAAAAPRPAAGTRPEQIEAVTTEPQNVTVRVSNSTAEPGVAGTATTELARYGFNVLDPDDYESAMQSTTVMFSAGNEQAAATVASAFPDSTIERVSGLGQVVQVVLGADFGTVLTPAASGSTVSVRISRSAGTTPTELPEDLTVTNAADVTCE